MPVGAVHGKRQEAMWEKAKVLARRGKAKQPWALTMKIFQNEKRANKIAHLDKSFAAPNDLVGQELVIARGHVLRRSVFDELLDLSRDPLSFLFKSENETDQEWHSNHPDGNHELHALANSYMKPRRLGSLRTAHLSGGWRTGNGLDPKVGGRIARAYESARHNPDDPAVQDSYRAFRREVKAQANHLIAHGYKAEPWTKPGQPYKNAQEMSADVRNNKHIFYFKSEHGSPTHKLLPNEDNDRFRWVHDVFGHAMGGNKFGPRPSHGETHAFLDHYQMFSPAARHALATETLGQNSWFNFSKHNEGRPIHEKEFAQQKATLIHPSLYEGLLKHTGLMKAMDEEEYPEDYGYCPAHPRARHNPAMLKSFQSEQRSRNVEMMQQYDQLLGMHGYKERELKKESPFREGSAMQEMARRNAGLHITKRIYDHPSGHTAIVTFAHDPEDPSLNIHHWNVFHPAREGRRDPAHGKNVPDMSSALDHIHGQPLMQSFAKAGGPRGMHVRPLGDSLRQQRDLEEKRYSIALRPRKPKLPSMAPAGKGKRPKLPSLPATLARSIVGFIRRLG